MKKKITLFAVLAVLLLSLVSCGTDYAAQDEVYGISTASILEDMQGMTTDLNQLDDASFQYLLSTYQERVEVTTGEDKESAQMVLTLLESWNTANNEVGTFVDFGEFTIEKAGKTVTATLGLNYTGRNAELVYVYNILGSHMTQTGANVNLEYTLGETMGRAAMNVLMGMATVFVVLILIMFIIFAFGAIPKIQAKFENRGKKTEAPEAPVVVEAPVQAATDDTELIAVIAAAIAASTGQSTDDFVVRSIKRRY